jgi:hypothetical protein
VTLRELLSCFIFHQGLNRIVKVTKKTLCQEPVFPVILHDQQRCSNGKDATGKNTGSAKDKGNRKRMFGQGMGQDEKGE